MLRAASGVLLSLALISACSKAPAREPSAAAPSPDAPALQRIEIPALVTFPEGIAYDLSANALYTGSAVDGTLIRINAETGVAEPVATAGAIVPGGTTTFPAMLGMKVDGSGRLWIAGGRTGKAWVVNVSDGSVLKAVTVPSAGTSLLNDVALAGSSAYFTDTFAPSLWRMTVSSTTIGNIEKWLDLTGSAIPYDDGPSINGIAATPDGNSLIVVQMAKGLLFKIDIATKAISAIDIGGADLSGADGLVLNGNTLYVVRQTAVEIVTIALVDGLARGTVVSRFKDPALAWPATAVKVGATLVVVNTQFNTRENKTTTLPFTFVRVPLARLNGS